MSNLKSKCCRRPVKVEGHKGWGTNYWVCTRCLYACDLVGDGDFADRVAEKAFEIYYSHENKGPSGVKKSMDDCIRVAIREELKGIGEKIGLEALKNYDDTKGRGEVAYIQQCVQEAFNKAFGLNSGEGKNET